MSDSVIDLGVLRHGPDPDPSPRPPRANGRQLRVALVALLALLTLAAAGAPQPRRSVVTLPAQPGADVLVDGDLAVVIEPTSTSNLQQRRLAAYRLPGGEPAWQAPLSADARYWGIFPLGELLVVTGFEIGPRGRDVTTIALDRATGAYRWQQPAGANRLADGNLLLRAGGESEPSVLRVVDPCCGTVRWQLPATTAEITFRETERGIDRLILNPPDGPTEVRDATTGAVLARADLRPADGGRFGLEVLNDLLLVIDRGSGAVTAYGLDQLDRRWIRPNVTVDFALDCGPVLCLRTGANQLQALDPATGEVRWSSDRWGWAWGAEDRLLANVVGGGDSPGRFVVLDAPTGQEVAVLGQWDLYRRDRGGPLTTVRKHPDGGVVVGEVDMRAGTVRKLDVLRDATGDCQVTDSHLLCVGPGTYRLWQLRR
ncbi:PQQ-binding-like beta-propeller repeat protein [Micromonospora sp. WMMD1155]|uniref:outer membrane protein assembly factor BamB family protein n=1 Tax=Micromonospora sp. WMMD1155 TaxID=3016094 RepID=UPI00249AC88A|nr:PQQ-binding-like beta-propeller repeat protein [Micromonospora sp. WMMD1155]WFE49608.1 PQQ-binding-like beta-propeller repeat protein [Micromonospora sp. WMMD1155]